MSQQSDLVVDRFLHSPKEGKPGEVNGEGDDVEQDTQQVHHQAEQHCLLTLAEVYVENKIWKRGVPVVEQEPITRIRER